MAAAHPTNTVIYALTSLLRWKLPADTNNVVVHVIEVTNALTTALGGYTVNNIKLPVLFNKDLADKFYAGSANVVNCLVYPSSGVFMQNTGSAEFNAHVAGRVSSVIWLTDTWDAYRCGMGEIHCGTATRRTIDCTIPWWQRFPGWK